MNDVIGVIGEDVKKHVDNYKDLFELIEYDTNNYKEKGPGVRLKAKKMFANIEEASKKVPNCEVQVNGEIIYFKGFLNSFDEFVSYLRPIN